MPQGSRSHLTPIERKVKLLERGVRITALARAIGCASQRGNVSEVIHGRRRNARIERLIAEFLEVSQAEWFGPEQSTSTVSSNGAAA